MILPILKLRRSFAAIAGSVALVCSFATSASATTADWSAYLFGPAHGSYNAAATAITTANADTLGTAWSWTPSPTTNPDGSATYVTASPTVVGGTIYIGASNGDEYALDETTGNVIWSRFIGYDPPKSCGTGLGVTSTAAVANDPVSGNPTVYVAGGNGYLYALDAATGSVVWRSLVHHIGTTQNIAYDWSSPTLVNGHVLMGIASDCDNPLARGALRMYDQATGALQDTYWVMPKGEVGGGIWTSAASEGSAVWVATGDTIGLNGGPPPDPGDSTSMVRLRINGDRLVRKEAWAPPSDIDTQYDLAGSPTLFDATIDGSVAHLVGACSNDGTYYVMRRYGVARGEVWSLKVSGYTSTSRLIACHTAAIWRANPATLIIAGRNTEIGGVRVPGSVQSIDPATGATIWETALQDGVVGSPTMNGNGLIAVASYSKDPVTHYAYLLDGSDGSILWQMPIASASFSQPVFADGYLFIQPMFGPLSAFCPGCSSA